MGNNTIEYIYCHGTSKKNGIAGYTDICTIWNGIGITFKGSFEYKTSCQHCMNSIPRTGVYTSR